jgi:Domain of unknown function (DUF4232)
VVEGGRQTVFLGAGRSRRSKPPAGRVSVAVPLAGAGRLAAALACAALAAGCSPSSPPSAAPAPPGAATSPPTAAPASSPATAVTAPPACATSALQVTQSAPDGYAGGFEVTIGFTNTSAAPCTLYGYPGVSLVSASHAQIGLSAKRLATAPVKLVTLAPGATAAASVQIGDAVNFPSPACSPVKAAYLRIFPPNQTTSVYLPNTSQTCAKQVPTLTVTAVQPGPGTSG